jgi:hypothetical protein
VGARLLHGFFSKIIDVLFCLTTYMKIGNQSKSIVLNVPALLWDGSKQLAGILSLTPKNLLFEYDDIQKSHLNLVIPLANIETVEFLLLFDFSRNGLKIKSKGEHFDLFVLDQPETFRWAIMKAIAGL